jgi:thioredoxin-related protein
MTYVRLVLVLLIFATAGHAQKKGNASTPIAWKSFNEGMTEAKKSGKKVLIDVYTDWCGWCKKMDAGTYSDKKVADYLKKNFVIIKLNPEKDGDVMYDGKKYSAAEFSQGMGVNGYPATLFLKSNGQPITLLPGYSEADMFLHVISFIGEDHYEKKKFADYLAEKGVKQ